jgi:hypothetical protein
MEIYDMVSRYLEPEQGFRVWNGEAGQSTELVVEDGHGVEAPPRHLSGRGAEVIHIQ